jgi:molybdate transport system substrate-binding protein
MSSRPAALVAMLAIVLVACSSGGSPSPSSPPATPAAPGSSAPATVAPGTSATPPAAVDIAIYGAASLKGVLDKARTAYEAAVPGVTLTISTDSSSALEAKIEQGAPADVFLSADMANPQRLVDKGLTDGPAVPLAGNKLAIIVPVSNPAAIRTPADLARAGVKVVAAGDAVPITGYAAQLVANLAKEPGYPAGFVALYTANIVSREDNVKAVVAKIELGEGDAGIVYVTDAAASTRVATVDLPDSANVLATCAGVVVKGSANAAAARDFLTWFAGPAGQAILTSFGFLLPTL